MWFNARLMIGIPTCEVGFVECLALKRHVRTVFAIPAAEQQEFASESVAVKRHQDWECGFILQRLDGAFDCNAISWFA